MFFLYFRLWNIFLRMRFFVWDIYGLFMHMFHMDVITLGKVTWSEIQNDYTHTTIVCENDAMKNNYQEQMRIWKLLNLCKSSE